MWFSEVDSAFYLRSCAPHDASEARATATTPALKYRVYIPVSA